MASDNFDYKKMIVREAKNGLYVPGQTLSGRITNYASEHKPQALLVLLLLGVAAVGGGCIGENHNTNQYFNKSYDFNYNGFSIHHHPSGGFLKPDVYQVEYEINNDPTKKEFDSNSTLKKFLNKNIDESNEGVIVPARNISDKYPVHLDYKGFAYAVEERPAALRIPPGGGTITNYHLYYKESENGKSLEGTFGSIHDLEDFADSHAKINRPKRN